MKKYILYTIAIISILFLIRCEKDENPELLKTVFTNKVPKLATMPLSEITDTSALSGGIINNDGGSKIIANGVCWSISPNPTINDNKTVDSIGNKNFTSKLTNLKAFTLYHIRSYATNNTGTAYGNTLLLKTSSNIPQINTQSISQITDSSVICGGDISSDGGAEINARGVCWSTSQNPTINNSKTLDSIGIGSFISNPIGLNAITTYYLRAYATNGVGTAYGEEKTFTTITAIPKLTTDSIKSITTTSAISGGYIKSTGGLPITAKGVCWSASPNPTTADNKTENGTGSSAFTSNITGLNPGTYYYIRAYATNSLGTAYGNEISFKSNSYLPTLSTKAITDITSTSANTGGNISNDGGEFIIDRGVCWSTTPNPTILNDFISNGYNTGSFGCTILGLNPGTTYYVRAYATNSFGTAYGNQQIFNTLAELPTLTTTAITSITSNSAISGGNIINEGGSIIARGICWSSSPNPTLTNNYTTNLSGLNNFTDIFSGLISGSTYYVRAYATNSIGTAYGNEIVFSTLLSIGQYYQGGIIAYILQSGDPGYNANVQHGFISAPFDQSTGSEWWNGIYISVPSTNTMLGSGYANTNNIVAIQGNGNYAAKLCNDLILNGYNDWYLPSRDELTKLYIYRSLIGGFSDNGYWSSSQYDINQSGTSNAWYIYFLNGNTTNYLKEWTRYVRAIRSF